jgi:hypothetical protein
MNELDRPKQGGRPPINGVATAIESEKPPTVTQLAERGKRAPTVDHLRGRSEADFKASTQVQGKLKSFADFVATADPAAAVRGASAGELPR